MKTLLNTLVSFWKINISLGGGVIGFILTTCRFIYWKIFGKKIFKFNFNYQEKSFCFYADNRVDLAALDEIFIKKEYEFEYKEMGEGVGKVILDLGANVGDTAIFYALKYPKATIYAVEPNPHVHGKLEKNTKQFPNIKVCKCAVSNTTGKVNLNFGDSHLGSSINVRAQNTKSVEVDVYSLRDFCAKENIRKVDILKFDIEGAEEYLLFDMEYIKGNVVQMVGEMHEDLVGAPLGPIVARLELQNALRTELSEGRYIIYGGLQSTKI